MAESSKISEICIQILDDCFAFLRKDKGPVDDEAVHQLRVATKRLRAAWKMVASDEGMTRKAELKKLSAMLAGDRDWFVLVSLSEQLEEMCHSAPFQNVIEHLEQNQPAKQQAGTQEALEAILEAEKSAWETVQFDSFREEQNSHRQAIRKSSKKAKAATTRAQIETDAEVWHTWRKRVKTLRYQREFLAEIQGRQPGKLDARISLLGTRLGERNDLANLTAVIVTMGNSPELRKAIAKEERTVMGNCRRLGRKCFG